MCQNFVILTHGTVVYKKHIYEILPSPELLDSSDGFKCSPVMSTLCFLKYFLFGLLKIRTFVGRVKDDVPAEPPARWSVDLSAPIIVEVTRSEDLST